MPVPPYLRANHASRPCTILLVEDEPFVREATCSLLKSLGFDVLTAADAQAAIKIYENFASGIDLVITDMVLPGKSGHELIQELQSRSPGLTFLLTSGYSNPEYEKETPDSRIYFLAKPYSKRTLLDKIEKILPSLRAREANGVTGLCPVLPPRPVSRQPF